jgi:hypothetical protein
MARYLVVANQTLRVAPLADLVRLRVTEHGEFHIVVPATAQADQQVPGEGDATSIAEARLQEALNAFRSLGAHVTGEVGHEDPMQAISDALKGQPAYTEIIVSTLPAGVSKWLRMDLPRRVERKFDLPVTTIGAQSS